MCVTIADTMRTRYGDVNHVRLDNGLSKFVDLMSKKLECTKAELIRFILRKAQESTDNPTIDIKLSEPMRHKLLELSQNNHMEVVEFTEYVVKGYLLESIRRGRRKRKVAE